jgi:hypothetical protein
MNRDSFVSNVLRSRVKLIVGVAIFAGLPLLGWGVADLRAFAGDPARLGYLLVVAALQLFALRFSGAGGVGVEGKDTVRRQRLAVVLLQVLTLAIIVAAPYSDRRDIAVFGEAEIGRYLGLVLFALGFITMLWPKRPWASSSACRSPFKRGTG